MNEDDPLDDFDPRAITLDGVTKVVHVAGTGPAVIVMTEMPGIGCDRWRGLLTRSAAVRASVRSGCMKPPCSPSLQCAE